MSENIPVESSPSVNPTDVSQTPPASEKNIISYIIIGLLVIGIIIVVYYGYNTFVLNSDSFIQKQERDDPVADFNLRAAIEQLRNKQKKIISGLSQY